MRLLNESDNAVSSDMRVRRDGLAWAAATSSEVGMYGSLSSVMRPSARFTVRVAYRSASSGLCVTMMTSLSSAISVSRSMICTLVLESSAPVGSSASRMSGSLMSARAMATRCICPPDICAGFLFTCSPRPTRSSASCARRRRSSRDTPDRVSASSTLASTVWWGIRL